MTIPGYVLAFAAAAALLPALLPVALALDLLRRRRLATARFLAVLLLYLAFEMVGLAVLGWIFATRGPPSAGARHAARLHRLECWWASALLGLVRRLYGLRLEVEGLECASPGPVIVIGNHVSVADVLLPAALVSGRLDLRLRYVAKRELVWDPCVDLAGHWLPNAFVARGSADTPGDVARVQALLEGLGPGDGIFLMPEGTRFAPERRERVLASFEAEGPSELTERARRLRHLLPPRFGGILGLFDGNPGADVVVMAHTGFEGVRRLSDVWNGVLVGRTIRVSFWRRPWASVPTSQEGRRGWLLDEWDRLDAWLGRHREPARGRTHGT